MSIRPTTPFKNDFSTPAPGGATPSMPMPFVRIAKGNTSSNEMRASANSVLPPVSGPVARWRGCVFGACEALDLKPGEQKILIVNKGPGPDGSVIEKPMVLRRTHTGDAYVFQTPEDSLHRSFQGLHLNGGLQMRHNMELVPFVPTHPQHKEANLQFFDLSDALGVPRGRGGN